jgi:hypothetical protein
MVLHDRETTDSAALTDKLVGKVRRGAAGEIRPHIYVFNDMRWSHDRQRMERRVMHVDRERDYYKQEWFDLEPGPRHGPRRAN